MDSFEARLKREVTPTSEEKPSLHLVGANSSPTEGDSPMQSLSEQLSDLYSEVEYLTSKFPNHTVRSLTDLAASLQVRVTELQTGGAVANKDHGLIPALIWEKISELQQQLADQAPVGIVEVDDTGIIQIYNRYESELAGVSKENAIGKNFFLEVAPCTNNRLFLGTFKSGVQSGSLDKKFNYTFTYKMKPTPVVIHLFRDGNTSRNFVFVKRR